MQFEIDSFPAELPEKEPKINWIDFKYKMGGKC